MDCPRCSGSGKIPDFLGGRLGGEACADCGGTGRAPGSLRLKPADVKICCSRTFEESITDWMFTDFTDFTQPFVKVDLFQVQYDKDMTTAEVEANLARLGLRPVSLRDLMGHPAGYRRVSDLYCNSVGHLDVGYDDSVFDDRLLPTIRN
ncbi:MAG: hypothetical protein V1738_06030 [Patescibacteria group bacterium]